MFILSIIGVVYLLGAPCRADQSADDVPSTLTNTRERQLDSPEVVLQLKYDGGELNRIYLTQFRKETKTISAPVPSRSALCSDLCSAGLGGTACGPVCPKMIPIGLKMALLNENSTETAYGLPRVAVCPKLCEFNLGEPLCNCDREELETSVEWATVCNVFCETDHYVLNGCPACEHTMPKTQRIHVMSARILSTAEGWQSWCNVQCRQGQGGAACNCDRAPFQ